MTENMTTDPTSTTGQPDEGQTPTGNAFDFSSALSAEFKENPSITKFGGDINKLAGSYISLQSLMGQGRVAIPKDDADTVAWGMYDKAFNVPETPDKYQLTANADIDLTEFKALMKQNHIPQATAQKLLDAHLHEFVAAKQIEQQQAETDKTNAEAELRKEWGMKYTQNLETARNFLKKVSGDDENFEYFNSKIGNDPRFIKLLAQMGNSISEGSLGGFEGQSSGFAKTPAEAKAELAKIMNDPNDAFWAGAKNKRNDPNWCRQNNASFVSEEERKQRVEYVQSLMQMQG